MSMLYAGALGKLKTLLDRLTSTRAGYIDRLDATVTSLYSTANWSGTKAGYLDAAISSLGPKPQTALFTHYESSSATVGSHLYINSYPGRYILSGALTANTYATIVNVVSNGGFVYVAAAGAVDGTGRTISIKVTIDGTAAIEKTSPSLSQANDGVAALACGYDRVQVFPVRFNSSLKIEVKSSLGETDKVFLKACYSLD